MKCEIRVPEPSILRDARPGDLFIARGSGHDECVLAILEPLKPLCSPITGSVNIIRCVVLACRVEPFEPGHRSAGTVLFLTPNTSIQFVEQTDAAKFRSRGAEHLEVTVLVKFTEAEQAKPEDQL